MTKIEQLEETLNATKIVISYLKSRLEEYNRREIDLGMRLNRARRLEREAKELP